MYSFLLSLHSGLRWLVLLFVVIAVLKSVISLFSKGSYSKFDETITKSFGWSMRFQFIIGITLYFISPLVAAALADMGAAMKDPNLRFFAVEHFITMLLAVGAAEVGMKKAKKAETDSSKFKFQAIFFGLSLVLMLVAIPWDRLSN